MITRLEEEAAEEADAKAFCDKETSESKAKQAELTAKSDKSQVRIEKATATIAELKQKIKTTQEQMAEMDAAQAEATSLRTKEHEEYLKASKDYKDSAEAVANAIAVLQDYYSSGSFVQAKQAPELGGAKTDIASTIMSMLEVMAVFFQCRRLFLNFVNNQFVSICTNSKADVALLVIYIVFMLCQPKHNNNTLKKGHSLCQQKHIFTDSFELRTLFDGR